MGFKPSKADLDLWIRDKGTHYEYIGTYVDDLLIASKNPAKIIEDLKQCYILKGVGIPEYYLGADIIQAEVEWALEPINWLKGPFHFCLDDICTQIVFRNSRI